MPIDKQSILWVSFDVNVCISCECAWSLFFSSSFLVFLAFRFLIFCDIIFSMIIIIFLNSPTHNKWQRHLASRLFFSSMYYIYIYMQWLYCILCGMTVLTFYSPIHVCIWKTDSQNIYTHTRTCFRIILQLNSAKKSIYTKYAAKFLYACVCENIAVALTVAIIVVRTLHSVHSIGWLFVYIESGRVCSESSLILGHLIMTVKNNICIIYWFYWFIPKK